MLFKSLSILIFIFLFVFFITPNNFVAQNNKQISSVKNDSIKITKLINIAKSFYQRNPDSAISYLQKARIIENNHPYIRLKIKIIESLGVAYNMKNELDSAFYYFNQSKFLAHKYNFKEEEIGAALNLGVVYSKQHKFENALNQYFKALSFFKITNQQQQVSKLLNNIGIVLSDQERYKESILYHKESIQTMINNHDLGANQLNISSNYLHLNKLDSAAYYIKLATDNFKQKEDDFGLLLSEGILGDICIENKNYSLAQQHYNNSIRISSAFGKNFSIGGILSLADLFNNLKQFNKAEKYYLKAKKIAIKTNDKNILDNIYLQLGKINFIKKEYKLASLFFSKRVELHDSLYAIEKDQKIADIIARYEIKEKQQKIESLHEANNTQLQKIKIRNLSITLLFFLLTLLVILLLFIKQKSKQKIYIINNNLQKYLLQIEYLENKTKITSNELIQKYNLTEREGDILILLGKGMSYSSIGDKIFISKNTVKYHMKNIYLKLNVKNKIEALNKIK